MFTPFLLFLILKYVNLAIRIYIYSLIFHKCLYVCFRILNIEAILVFFLTSANLVLKPALGDYPCTDSLVSVHGYESIFVSIFLSSYQSKLL